MESSETTIDALIERYASILFDAYGVLVTAGGALPGAAAIINRLNTLATPYYVVTNDASRLPETVAQRLAAFGLSIPSERVITSGVLLTAFFHAQGLVGRRCLVLGPQDSRRYVEHAGGEVVAANEDFDVLVVCDDQGYPFLETVNAAISGAFRALDCSRELTLVAPNPDLIYPAGNGDFSIAAGSIAAVIEQALQLRYSNRDDLRFARLGKPHPAIFEEAIRRFGGGEIVMIGDQLRTDIAGANAVGIDSVLMEGGVTAGALDEASHLPRPTWRLRSLLA